MPAAGHVAEATAIGRVILPQVTTQAERGPLEVVIDADDHSVETLGARLLAVALGGLPLREELALHILEQAPQSFLHER